MSDTLRRLVAPFPAKFIHSNPSGGGSYIKHHVIEQRLIEVFGIPPTFEKVEVIRGDVAGYTTSANKVLPDLTDVIVGVVCRMTVSFPSGGQYHAGLSESVTVEEAGDCEQPHNWRTDGQRLKDAMSDAYKRCAMRLGCGLHLWSQEEYFLYDKLKESGGTPSAKPPSDAPPGSTPYAKHDYEEAQETPDPTDDPEAWAERVKAKAAPEQVQLDAEGAR